MVRELLTQHSYARPALRASIPACRPSALPKMIPAVVLLLLLLVEQAEALGDPQICYILDSILFLYGIILTLLYCRLKVRLGRCGEGRGQGQAGGRGTVVSA